MEKGTKDIEMLKNFILKNTDLLLNLHQKNNLIKVINNAYRELSKKNFFYFVDSLRDVGVQGISKTECCGVKYIELYFFDGDSISINDIENLKEQLINYHVNVMVDYERENIKIFFLYKKNKDVCENNEQRAWFNKYSATTLEKAKKGEFADLLHFIFYHTVEKIKYVNEGEMKRLWAEVDELISVNNYTSVLWGFYSNKEVYLCRDLIEESAEEFQETYEKKLCSKCKNEFDILHKNMFNLLYEKVFTHEFGHLVFDWVESTQREKQEKQANYFSSYITDGKIDEFILWVTRQQPKEYNNPYLKGNLKAEDLYK